MDDADKGERSPISGDTVPDKPQKSGQKRRRWRSKKKRVVVGESDNSAVSSGAEPWSKREQRFSIEDGKSTDSSVRTGKFAANNAASNPSDPNSPQNSATINGLGIRKKSRQKRHRRRSSKATCQSAPPQAIVDEKNSDQAHRHRRQPMSQEKAASYKDATQPRHRSYNGKKKRTEGQSANLNGSNNPYQKPRPTYHKNNSKRYYAALDLGTNNCRLLVAVPQGPGKFRVVDAFSRIVRLGEGLGASGKLSDEAMARTIEALKVCRDKLNLRLRTRHRLIATEACRRAENGQYFLTRVQEETGLDLEIVDRATEARLAVSGCGSLVDHNAHGVVLFDIGGGSSELALLDISKRRSRRLSDHITSWASLPLGVVTLSEKFGGGKNVTPQIFEDMVVEVSRMLDQFEGRNALAHTLKSGRFHLLGTSGTVTTLAGVHLNLRRYDRRRVDGTWLSDADVDAMISKILSMSFEDRVNNPCIGADRADLVLAGCAILEAIRRLWPSPRLRVADRGLREGLLTEMMAEDGVWRRNRKRQPRRSVSEESRNS